MFLCSFSCSRASREIACLQLLEDFLRNKVKTADQVKGLKMDYGFGGFGGPPSSGGPGSLFGSGAFHGQY